MNKIYSFEQLTDSVELLERKPPRFIIWFLSGLILLFVIFVVWAYFGKVDIVSKGTVIIQNKFESSLVRSKNKGILDNVLVKSGDFVKTGDVLFQIKEENENVFVKASMDGEVQFNSTIQSGDLIESGKEILSIVPKNLEKRARIILSPQDRKNIKKGDKIIYSFNTERIDKYIGEIVYIAAEPVYNKEFKSYMYELEATIDSNNDELYAGMMGQGSVLIGSEPIWKFLLKKMI
ncbi:TPA: HlyD family efflux transporter periplasmic adaptor subunit [Bacillus cereus]|uniref:Multidrug resistance protein MdtA-like barrel-sandwich hybrid domain-containing protein n=2 Tax=Bacillus cereus group TaxID=86661 RepID=B0FXS2_BACTU|nr:MULTISPECIES: HlyD family efflux transporter periplasmic adaptor subunit [Bacillus]ABY68471.1 hypothetical protein pFR12.5_01 [Bacillus thuringiensis]MCU4998394.1 HlyD family efflux transporter periplasmic adaptor subunit [Bacillus cereus]MCU5320994.1 HlyD family efflux transporter periplasmic adaptor subunit [Bacillus cereus]MCU5572637.1 HlyD family efflux transporter periplasmic adaptor subunit [Bacillus cereus]MEB9946156.1 HlyD family efflux transporter periplasmic adaptor subunit [Bacil